jgi:mycothiol synthase
MTVELRAPSLDDLEALTDLVNRQAHELYGEREETPESMALWLTGPGLDPATDSRIAIVAGEGEVRGYVDIDADPDPRYWVDLRVPPSESANVREALMDWAESQAAERGTGKADALIRFYTSRIDDPTNQELEARGYRLIRHSYRMRIDFDDDPPQPEWPEGISVRTGTADDAKTVYEIQHETFEDSWEFNPDPYGEWTHWMTSYEGFDPSLWFIAEADREVAGVSLCRVHEADENLGWVRVLGVRRPWRRRGLGRALLLHSFHEFRRRGISSVGLGVDAESLTGANLLYENAGMRVVRQSNIYEKSLS